MSFFSRSCCCCFSGSGGVCGYEKKIKTKKRKRFNCFYSTSFSLSLSRCPAPFSSPTLIISLLSLSKNLVGTPLPSLPPSLPLSLPPLPGALAQHTIQKNVSLHSITTTHTTHILPSLPPSLPLTLKRLDGCQQGLLLTLIGGLGLTDCLLDLGQLVLTLAGTRLFQLGREGGREGGRGCITGGWLL